MQSQRGGIQGHREWIEHPKGIELISDRILTVEVPAEAGCILVGSEVIAETGCKLLVSEATAGRG
jgi:hypothetical protein